MQVTQISPRSISKNACDVASNLLAGLLSARQKTVQHLPHSLLVEKPISQAEIDKLVGDPDLPHKELFQRVNGFVQEGCKKSERNPSVQTDIQTLQIIVIVHHCIEKLNKLLGCCSDNLVERDNPFYDEVDKTQNGIWTDLPNDLFIMISALTQGQYAGGFNKAIENIAWLFDLNNNCNDKDSKVGSHECRDSLLNFIRGLNLLINLYYLRELNVVDENKPGFTTELLTCALSRNGIGISEMCDITSEAMSMLHGINTEPVKYMNDVIHFIRYRLAPPDHRELIDTYVDQTNPNNFKRKYELAEFLNIAKNCEYLPRAKWFLKLLANMQLSFIPGIERHLNYVLHRAHKVKDPEYRIKMDGLFTEVCIVENLSQQGNKLKIKDFSRRAGIAHTMIGDIDVEVEKKSPDGKIKKFFCDIKATGHTLSSSSSKSSQISEFLKYTLSQGAIPVFIIATRQVEVDEEGIVVSRIPRRMRPSEIKKINDVLNEYKNVGDIEIWNEDGDNIRPLLEKIHSDYGNGSKINEQIGCFMILDPNQFSVVNF